MLENIDEELVRCRPCGYVMKKSELGTGVCPACGLPHTVFEPYREKVSAKRLFLLGLDIHPIAIHLSQTFVAMIPGLMIFHLVEILILNKSYIAMRFFFFLYYLIF